jgi:hypothetical protein
MSGKWHELQPDLFAGRDHPVLRAARNTLILVRLNQIGPDDELLSFEIMAGMLMRANRDEGFVLSLVGGKSGQELALPMVPAAFRLQPPGQYMLSCGAVVEDPGFLAAFDIYPPMS